jgi:hypothetical protein
MRRIVFFGTLENKKTLAELCENNHLIYGLVKTQMKKLQKQNLVQYVEGTWVILNEEETVKLLHEFQFKEIGFSTQLTEQKINECRAKAKQALELCKEFEKNTTRFDVQLKEGRRFE